MRVMNDNLIVRIALTWAIFMSVWSAFTLFINRSANRRGQMCSGIFPDNRIIKDWQNLVQPKPKNVPDIFLWACLLITVVLMLLMKIRSYINIIRQPLSKVEIKLFMNPCFSKSK